MDRRLLLREIFLDEVKAGWALVGAEKRRRAGVLEREREMRVRHCLQAEDDDRDSEAMVW